jgi:hypothetical protein
VDEKAASDPVVRTGGTRDFRIDFFRGLALYMILVDHIEFNPLAKFTYQRFGFSDSAEIFVFLSGVSCGIAYHSVLMHRGLTALVQTLIKRAGLIYVFYLAASGVTIFLVASTAEIIMQTGALNRCFAGCVESIFGALWSAALLIEQPHLPSLLVLYMALTIWVFPILLVGVRLSLFQSFGVAVPVLDRTVPRDKISKAREPAMDAAQVATVGCCLDRDNRAAEPPAEVDRERHSLRPLLAPILRFGPAAG